MTTNVVPFSKRRPAWSWGDRVRKVRRDMGMTQAQFAELTGFGEKAIAAWEAGRNTPDVPEASVALERSTGVDRLWWIGWDAPFNDPGQQEPPASGKDSVKPDLTFPCLSDGALIIGPWLAPSAVAIPAA